MFDLTLYKMHLIEFPITFNIPVLEKLTTFA